MKNPNETFAQYIEKNKDVFKENKDAQELFNTIRNGERQYAKVHRTEDTARDTSWIDPIEDAIPHLFKIVDNPRSFIKTVEYLVPAELAKKTGPESVKHLSTHSQFVKEVKDDGEIIPSKILTTEGEIDVQIYENRLVMTLLWRLHAYIERRYLYLKHFANLSDTDMFYLDNDYDFGGARVQANVTLTVTRPALGADRNKLELDESLKRVEQIRKYIGYFMNSNFMKVDMKNARPVTPPIMLTNMLKGSPDYHGAYDLWQFLNQEEHASMEFVVNEDIKVLDEEEQKRIDFISYLFAMDLSTLPNMPTKTLKKREFHTQIIKNPEDYLYMDEKFSDAEFVRADDQYYEDLKKPLEEELAAKSEAVQKALFKKEQDEKRKIEQQKKAAELLRARKDEVIRILAQQLAIQRAEEEKYQAEEAKKRAEEEAAILNKKIEALEAIIENAAKKHADELDGQAEPTATLSPSQSEQFKDENLPSEAKVKEEAPIQEDKEALESEVQPTVKKPRKRRK